MPFEGEGGKREGEWVKGGLPEKPAVCVHYNTTRKTHGFVCVDTMVLCWCWCWFCLRVGGNVCLTRLHVFALSWPFSIHRGCSEHAIAVLHCRISRSSAVASTDRPSATTSVASLHPSNCTEI